MQKLHLPLFLALCLWTATAWVAAESVPTQLPTLASQGFHYLLLGLATTIVCLARRKPLPTPNTLFWNAATGLALFAVPTVLLASAQGMVSNSLNVVVFALLPIVIVVAQGQMRWLLPSLAGVAGLLVLLPVSFPTGQRGFLGLSLVVAAMAFTAGAILFLHRDKPDAWGTAAICLTNGLVLTIINPVHTDWTLHTAAYESLRCLILTTPETLLLLWLIPHLDPRRLSARWLLAPLLTVVEGYIFLRPTPDTRLLLGLSLLAIGGTVLYAANDEDPKPIRLT